MRYSSRAVAPALGGLVVIALALACLGGAPAPAQPSATDTSTTTSLPPAPGGVNSIIGPAPGQGVAPASKEDRGGWLQLTVAGVLFCAVAGVGALAWRDSRRSRVRSSEPT